MKIYLDTIGCRLNQAEIESMARQFRASGHEIVGTAGEADSGVSSARSPHRLQRIRLLIMDRN
jgi:tRNA A37 methylthiotransferase MiaB